ncbi:flagellar biosynthesis regulator FlaF [Sneathiella sp.]|uniref:flagellar biosynthesis regulator FlaF n=1 Tax=Sneathiella sp. TaxID=1964365 RepID=UPI002604D88E|nr:flagellar biosynthesis regulator FlaF [Sneathiella sp.]MDF2367956.1 flagellar biosynthesis regulator FlaF [Sneathiella sp.]
MSVAAYQKANQNAENPRQTEYRAFALFTRAMEEADKEDNVMERIRAVANNRRLWLTMQMDLLSEENALPDDLKGRLLSIAFWVGRYSLQAMKGEASVAPLITVNKQIMEGMKPQDPTKNPETTPPPSGLDSKLSL